MTDGLDTSVVMRLLTGTPTELEETARHFVASALSPVSVSDLVIGESYYALKHHYGTPHREAVRALSALLSDPRVQSTGSAKNILSTMASSSAKRDAPELLDRLIHADYARDGVRLATFDRELSRLAGTNLLG